MNMICDICRKCVHFKKVKVETKFGVFLYKCDSYNIGRNIDSESCDRGEFK
jgi:hypothetical protein